MERPKGGQVSKVSLQEIDRSALSEEELAVLQVLKPYIGHCLTLNHDINNPLSGIIGYCEVLLADADTLSEEQRGYLDQIMQCAERIKTMVEKLCDHKISISQKVDLNSVTDAYKKIAAPLDDT
ncbi:MAG: histidine kinase dimerization/phospho-acceptor domain-containing protein [Candidatus Zixiibacteriota bacterium]